MFSPQGGGGGGGGVEWPLTASGDLDMDGNDIDNCGQLNGTGVEVSGNLTAGNITTQDSVTVDDGVSNSCPALLPAGLKVGENLVVQGQGAAVDDPTEGGTVDTECRAALIALLDRLRAHGLIGSGGGD